MNAVFAQRLAQLRRAAGVSQRQAAADLNVSQALLSHYEKGIREPGLDFVVRAADYYNVPCDLLLGRSEPAKQSSTIASAPNQYARETERDIRNAIDVTFDLLSRYYDPNVYCYASIYASEVVYELLRQLARLAPDYQQERFFLSDKSFDSGAVVSDATWVRTQYILAVKQMSESNRTLPSLSPEAMEARYGTERTQSVHRLLSLVGHRTARQNLAENAAYNEMFRLKAPTTPIDPDELYSDSTEEVFQ